jgi:putative hydrolase of the HAD superfamily
VTRWLLLDYGGVLCTHQPEADRLALVSAAGAPPGPFWDAYWRDRGANDRGELDPAPYWAAVLGGPVEPALVAELERLDLVSWSHRRQESVDVVRSVAGARLAQLALLSNAPASLADAIDSWDWMSLVPRRFYSCRLGTTKPDPAAYRGVLDALGAEPADVTFVDDRAENIAGAAALGMRALLFTDPTTLAADLGVEPA